MRDIFRRHLAGGNTSPQVVADGRAKGVAGWGMERVGGGSQGFPGASVPLSCDYSSSLNPAGWPVVAE